MKFTTLIVLGLIFLWHLFKGLVQSWLNGWPFQKEEESINKDSYVFDLELHQQLTKKAIKSLVICFVVMVVVQFLL